MMNEQRGNEPAASYRVSAAWSAIRAEADFQRRNYGALYVLYRAARVYIAIVFAFVALIVVVRLYLKHWKTDQWITQLSSVNVNERRHAGLMLNEFGSIDAESARRIVQFLSDDCPEVRVQLLHALMRCKPGAFDVPTDILSRQLVDEQDYVRRSAVWLVARLRDKQKSEFVQKIELMSVHDPSPMVRKVAIEALTSIGQH